MKEDLEAGFEKIHAPHSEPSQPGKDGNALDAILEVKGNHLSFSEVHPVDIKVRNLAVEVDVSPSPFSPEAVLAAISPKRKRSLESKPKTKTILRDVSADMPAGSLTAIIGGSGSGKTSLLNTMAQRMTDARLTVTGSTAFNGRPGIEAVRTAYVMQQDVLLPTLTVRETLQYAADLRLPPPTTAVERKNIVEEVILELGLKEAADTRIGSHVHKGCSGGEKRRTSIGVQLLSNPSVLWLDEPTTGLDATSAFQLVRTLEALASRGRTIVCSIHQPRSEIWGLFHNIIVLTRGRPVYSGSLERCIPHFSEQGLNLPPFVNPAEFVIDIAAIDNRTPELEAETSKKVESLQSHWLATSEKMFGSEESIEPLSEQHSVATATRRAAFVRETRVLTSRTWKTTLRDPMGVAGCLLEAVLMGIIVGWIFLLLPESQSGIRSRQGALYTSIGLQGYLFLMFETYRLSIDVQLFDRERGEGVAHVVPFLASRRLARLLLEDIPVPFIFGTIFYFMAGFRANAAQFFIFTAINIISQYVAVAFATVCVALDRTFAGASVYANLMFTVQAVSCGYFLQSNSIPIYVRWLKWTAYVFYGFGALCVNEFMGHFYDCPLPGGESNPACAPYTGAFVLDSLGFPPDWLWRPIIAFAAFAVGFMLLSGIILHFKKVSMSIARARTSDSDDAAGKENLTARSADAQTVDIRLDRFGLELHKRTILFKKLPVKTILQPLTTDFQPGQLNVIMGPSGSGKTSLLNALALRLHDSVGTKYRASGRMTFNGGVPSNSVIRSVCSYVCQDDDALHPSLTVRETLKFAAGLRLPSHMSKEEKNQRAEAVLMKMGLKDCADNLIGGELIKGISGGEKRRVTIAVQILTEPRVLLLDEPTSGLDAFTASSIMDVLQGLAMEGRTVILTIHQSRSDLFSHFGNVLLLARGGPPCYSGPGAQMLPHFTAQGFPCPTTTNPADFALDLITIDLQRSDREEASRKRVKSLVAVWDATNHNAVSMALTASAVVTTPAQLRSLKRSSTPFFVSYPILVKRSSINIRRQPDVLVARLMQVIGLAIILAFFYSPLRNDYFSVQNRVGFLQQTMAFYFVGMLQNVAVYPNEQAVFYREHDDNAYGIGAFFAQYLTCEVPFELVSCLVFAVFGNFATGLPRTPTLYFALFFNVFCVVNCGESLGIMFNTLFTHTGFAVNIISVCLSLSMAMSGILSVDMPAFLNGVNYLSPVRYSVRNLAPYMLRDVVFTCDDAQRLPGGSCPINTGYDVLALFKLGDDPLVNILCLGAVTIIYRVLAYLLLVARRTHWSDLFERERK